MEREYTYFTSVEMNVDEPEVVLRVSGFENMRDAEDIAQMIHNLLANDEVVSVH